VQGHVCVYCQLAAFGAAFSQETLQLYAALRGIKRRINDFFGAN